MPARKKRKNTRKAGTTVQRISTTAQNHVCSINRKPKSGPHCAPNIVNTAFSTTCLTKREIREVATKYNQMNRGPKLNLKADPKALHKALGAVMRDHNCDHEVCWHRIINTRKLESKYKPKNTVQKYGWLSNIDLDDVMAQYELKYTDFKYIGTFPIDFAEPGVSYEYDNFDLVREYSRGMRQFGAIFNSDNSRGGGIHWFAAFIDLKGTNNCRGTTDNRCAGKYTIEFVDSAVSKGKEGHLKIQKEIYDFMDTVQKIARDRLNINLLKRVNERQYQKGNSECGVYSAHFIISRLEGITFDEYVKNAPTDACVHNFRGHIFRPRKL